MFKPLAVKLHAPPLRYNAVPRPRLTQRLSARPITLISAQAGSGKSTLLSEWIAHTSQPIAWVSLDADDNDPVRFWSYVVAALQRFAPQAGQTLSQTLNTGSLGALQPLLIDLLNDLETTAQPIRLVLDDYHVIITPAIHDALHFVLDHLPGTLRVVIATRIDPPLPLPRWRVRDQLTELRGADLQFTPDEAAAFLTHTMGLSLTPADTHTLTARTEGWIAGLQLAALSLHDATDAHQFVTALAGTHQHILDYLVEEVLTAQPEPVQDFLMHTSILARFNAALCDAITKRSDSADLLNKLDKGNLFLVTLDTERQWFRYHHLFAELLRARLAKLHPTATATLHLTASQWFEQAGSIEESIGYALAAKDFERAVQLIERVWLTMLHSGQIVTALRWLDALPADVLRAAPLLNVAYGWGLVLSGKHAAIEPYLQAAERAVEQQIAIETWQSAEPRVARLQAEVACLRALAARARGEAARAQAYAEQAIVLAPPEYGWLRGNAYVILGQVYFDQGQADQALAVYQQALPLALGASNYVAVSLITTYSALAQRLLGRLREAAAICREGLRRADELHFEQLPAVSVIDVTLATVYYDWNDLDEAERHARHAYELGQRSGYAEALRVGGALIARIYLARGQVAAAAELCSRLATGSQSGAAAGLAMLIDTQVRCMLAQGDVASAAQIAARLVERTQPAPEVAQIAAALIQARVAISDQRLTEALTTLTASIATLDARALIGPLIEALVLRTKTYAQLNQTDRALADLRRALSLGQPENFVRVFVNEGETLRLLLSDLRFSIEKQSASQGRDQLIQYVTHLGSAFSTVQTSAITVKSGFRIQNSEIQLTDRELEVLRLMAQGLANSEIAAKMVVAESTVKKHINHLFDKLDVQARVQAILKARELGLIDP
ncbi:MAG: LuxR C-terminal-related transcriptional regulator [Anaerolineae bacterium]